MWRSRDNIFVPRTRPIWRTTAALKEVDRCRGRAGLPERTPAFPACGRCRSGRWTHGRVLGGHRAVWDVQGRGGEFGKRRYFLQRRVLCRRFNYDAVTAMFRRAYNICHLKDSGLDQARCFASILHTRSKSPRPAGRKDTSRSSSKAKATRLWGLRSWSKRR